MLPTAKNSSLSGTSCCTLCAPAPALEITTQDPQTPPHPGHCSCPFRLRLTCHLLRELSLTSWTRSNLSVTRSLNTADLSSVIHSTNFPVIAVTTRLAAVSSHNSGWYTGWVGWSWLVVSVVSADSRGVNTTTTTEFKLPTTVACKIPENLIISFHQVVWAGSSIPLGQTLCLSPHDQYGIWKATEEPQVFGEWMNEQSWSLNSLQDSNCCF